MKVLKIPSDIGFSNSYLISNGYNGFLIDCAEQSVYDICKNLNIKIEWRGLSNIEAQLMQDSRLTICRNVFFQTDSAVQACCESLDKHKIDLFENINTRMKPDKDKKYI